MIIARILEKLEKITMKTVEEHLESLSEADKTYYLTIFLLLNQSERFLKFVEDNYVIGKFVDDDNGETVSLQVTEKPATRDLNLTLNEQFRMMTVLKAAGVEQATNVLNKLMNVITGNYDEKKEPTVVLADESDMKKEIVGHNTGRKAREALKKKLD